MVITRRIIKFWIIFYFPFLIFNYYRVYLSDKRYELVYTVPLRNHIGEKFNLENFLDSNERPAEPDFTSSELTIVDFWFSDCQPCLREMKQFNKLIAGKDKEIKIISISINSFSEWKRVMTSTSNRFSFFSKPLSNWQHLVMKSNEDPQLNNDISGESIKTLSDRFQSQQFPMYFVVDTSGKIIATPFSAVDFLLDRFSRQNGLTRFLTDGRTWSRLYSVAFSSLIQYSGYFWILLLIIGGFKYFRNRAPKNGGVK